MKRLERRPVALVALSDPAERAAVEKALAPRFDVTACADGAHLVAALPPATPTDVPPVEAAASRPDIVVTCALLPAPGPELDAMTALRQRDPFLPVILLVDAGDEHARASAMARGALAVLDRPADADAIAGWAGVARACFAPEPIDLTASVGGKPPARVRPRRGPAPPPAEVRVLRRAEQVE